MKKLFIIIVLFACMSLLSAQKIIGPTWVADYYRNPVITFDDLIGYQKECHNDSLLIEGAPFRWVLFPSTKSPFGHEFIEQKTDTVIYKAPTFEGFIEYMKKKYKQ